MKRYGIPLLTMLVGYLAYHLTSAYAPAAYHVQAVGIVTAAALFALGVSMSTRSKNSSTWVKKTAIIAAVVFLVCFQLHLISVPEISNFIRKFGVSSFLYDMLYVYFGFIFF